MHKQFKPQDHYFHKAKQDGYVARSAYKLDEIVQKYNLLTPRVRTVLDIGCAPGSWLQYLQRHAPKATVIGFDLKTVQISLPNVYTYAQDVTDVSAVQAILAEHAVQQVDMIVSDMAPDTIGDTQTDAIRSIGLIEDTLWMYKDCLRPDGCFVIKVFMGPRFDAFVQMCRAHRGAKRIKVYKPAACRASSKETYVVCV